MDTQVENVATLDPWSYWRLALANRKPVDAPKGVIALGFYRARDGEAIAFSDEGAGVVAWRSGDKFPAPTQPDAMLDLYARVSPYPVTHEAFVHFCNEGRWPDEIAPVEVAADLPAHERAEAELTAQREALAAWIKDIGKVQTQEQADKAGNFADEFAKIEKRVTAEHKAAKEPFLEGGRAVDATWKPVIARADELKRYAKKLPEAWLIAEKQRLQAEERARQDEIARIAREAEERRREAEAAGAPPPAPVEAPPIAPPPQKAKAAKVHLRSVTKHNIVSMRDVLTYLANMNDHPAELIATVQVIVNRMRLAGVEVPGVKTETTEVAA